MKKKICIALLSLIGILVVIRIILSLVFVKYVKIDEITIPEEISIDTLREYQGYQTGETVLQLIKMANILRDEGVDISARRYIFIPFIE